MSYGHAWHLPRPWTRDEFVALATDIGYLWRNLPSSVHIRGLDGRGTPSFGYQATIVEFNGDVHWGESADPFILVRCFPHNPEDCMCRTRKQPYDLLVCGALLAMQHRMPEMIIESTATPLAWSWAVRWYEDTLERPAPSSGPWAI